MTQEALVLVDDEDALASMPRDAFAAYAASRGLTLRLYRGTATHAPTSGPQWYTTLREAAEGYARHAAKVAGNGDAVVLERIVVMRRPLVVRSVEMINLGLPTIERARAEGYDGIVSQFRPLWVEPPQIYAVVFS